MTKQDKDFCVGDTVKLIGTPFIGKITGICEDMPHYPFIIEVSNGKVWRFSLDGKLCPNHNTAKLKKIRISQIGDSNFGT